MTIVIFIVYNDQSDIIYPVSLLISSVLLFRIALDVNSKVKFNLGIMGEYDEHIKAKLNMTFLEEGILPNHLVAPVTLESSIPTFIEISKKK